MAIITAIGLLLRLAWLRQPMRYDESTTFLDIAQAGFRGILTQYGPNNHVLHTLLVRVCTLATSAEWAIRVPAFVAGVLIIPLAAAVGTHLFDRTAGLFAAALVACSGHLIEYSTNARGYSMVAVFTLLQILLAERIVLRAKHRDFAAFAVVTALGCFTIPTMLYPTAGTLAWAALLAIGRHRAIAWNRFAGLATLYAIAGVMMIALLYTPILLQPDGWHNLTGNRWIAPIESGWGHALVRVGQEVAIEWSLGLTPFGLAIVAIVAAFAIVHALRHRDARSSWLLVAAAVSVAMMFVQRVVPFARVFGFALPMLLITSAGGIALLARRFHAKCADVGAPFCGAVLACYVLVAKVPDRASAFDKFPPAAAVLDFVRPQLDQDATAVFGVVASAPSRYVAISQHLPPIVYRAGARRLLLVTRVDESPLHVLETHHLRPADFKRMRLVYSKGVARVYELLPVAGRTPRPHRPPATLP